MAYMPPEVDQILQQMREVLLRWHNDDTLGEVAIVRGYHQLEVEERPRRKHKAVKRESGGKAIVKLG